MMTRSKREIAMLAIALIGLFLSAYAVTLHYASGPSKICDINAVWSCDTVNKSDWSTFLGIPVAILGLLSYLAVFLVLLFRTRIQRVLDFTVKDFSQYLLLLTAVMFAFQAYLTAMEVLFIGAYCIVCIGSQVCTFLLVTLAFLEHRR